MWGKKYNIIITRPFSKKSKPWPLLKKNRDKENHGVLEHWIPSLPLISQEMLNKMHTPLLTLGSLMCRNEDETYLALWLPGLSYLCDSAKPHAWYIKRYCVFLLLPSEMSDRIEN